MQESLVDIAFAESTVNKEKIRSFETASILAAAKEKILSRWEILIREALPEAHDTSRGILRDSLPLFLEVLADGLREGLRENVFANLSRVSKEHGEERANYTDYNLEQIFFEYDLLRKIIFEQLELRAPLPIESREIILDLITMGMAKAGKKYVEVTGRRNSEMEKKLALKSTQFKAIFEIAPVGFVMVNAHTGRLTNVNQSFCQIVDYRPEELYRMTIGDLTYPDDRLADDENDRDLVAGIISTYDTEKRFVRKDKKIVWVNMTASLLDVEPGEALSTIAVVSDISSRKSIENQLRIANERTVRALDVSNAGVFNYWPATDEVDWSEQENKIFAFPLGTKKLTGREVFDRIHAEDRERVMQALNRSALELVDYNEEFRVIWPEQKVRWVLGKGGVLRDEGGAICISGFNIDITERKEIESERTKLIADLDNEKHLRNQFISALTHDLRTPLSMIKMSGQLIASRPNDAEGIALFSSRILKNVERTDKMIQDLLDASRVRAGEILPTSFENCRLDVEIKNCVNELNLLFQNRIALITDEPVSGYWSPAGFRRVIENLCSNAIKYGEANSTVSVRLKSLGEFVTVSVHNFGLPLSPHECENLFRMFHRTPKASASGQKGWGIGLTIVKGVIDAHGGSISVKSTEEDGTTFTFSLPIDARGHAPSPQDEK